MSNYTDEQLQMMAASPNSEVSDWGITASLLAAEVLTLRARVAELEAMLSPDRAMAYAVPMPEGQEFEHMIFPDKSWAENQAAYNYDNGQEHEVFALVPALAAREGGNKA